GGVLLLLLEPRLQVNGERELARADAELEIGLLELLLRAFLLRLDRFEALAQARDLAADSFEVGVAGGLGGEGDKDEDREGAPHPGAARRSLSPRAGRGWRRRRRVRGATSRTHPTPAWPPAAAPLSSTSLRRASADCRPSPRR